MSDLASLLPVAANYPLGEGTPKPDSIDSSPVESSVTLVDENGVEIGIWECTPGSWTSTKNGFGEFMHFVSGHGWIIDADGRFEITPDSVKYLPNGWTGTWVVDETVRKIYVIVPA